MACAAFDYVAVGSYDEAVARLAEHGDEAKIIAGGQSLVPMMNLRLARPGVLIDINGVDQREPSVEGGTLRLPAMTRHRTLAEHPMVAAHCPLLADAIWHVGNVRVRNRGTIGGSLAHGDPTAEIGTCALALEATVVVRGADGERTIPARDLFVTYLTTALDETEVITDVLVPVTGPGRGWSFHEMVRRTSDLAIVAVAARVDLSEQGDAIAGASVALAGVADRVVLAEPHLLAGLAGLADMPGMAGHADMAGSAPDGPALPGVIADVADSIASSVDPTSDLHASADYRRRLVRVLTARALRDAYTNAREAAA